MAEIHVAASVTASVSAVESHSSDFGSCGGSSRDRDGVAVHVAAVDVASQSWSPAVIAKVPRTLGSSNPEPQHQILC